MSDRKLMFNVKALHVISLSCANCGHGTIFDFANKDYLEGSISPFCAVCKTELEIDLKQELKAYSLFYESMSRCQRVEFRVRGREAEVALSASEIQQAVSAVVAEFQDALNNSLSKGCVNA